MWTVAIVGSRRIFTGFCNRKRLSLCFLSSHHGHYNFQSKTEFSSAINSTKNLSTQRLNYKAVFIGSDNFSLPSLIALTHLLSPENVSVVVSNENNIIGKYAKKKSLEWFHWNYFKSEDFVKEFEKRKGNGQGFEFGVVASFGYLIPARVINRFPVGILNVHASLLPKWRGAAPIAYAIINNDSVTGVSIMKIAPHRFDIGPVLLQSEIHLHPHVRAPELNTILSNIGADALSRVISDLPQYLSNPVPQEESKATLSPKLTPEMANVDWSSMSSLQVYNLFRGLGGFSKLKTNFLSRKVDLDDVGLILVKNNGESSKQSKDISARHLDAATDFENFYSYPVKEYVPSLPENASPGQIVVHNDLLCVKCSNGESGESQSELLSWIFVRKVKIGTKKWMSAKDFKNGFLSKSKLNERYFVYSREVDDNDISIAKKIKMIEK